MPFAPGESVLVYTSDGYRAAEVLRVPCPGLVTVRYADDPRGTADTVSEGVVRHAEPPEPAKESAGVARHQ